MLPPLPSMLHNPQMLFVGLVLDPHKSSPSSKPSSLFLALLGLVLLEQAMGSTPVAQAAENLFLVVCSANTQGSFHFIGGNLALHFGGLSYCTADDPGQGPRAPGACLRMQQYVSMLWLATCKVGRAWRALRCEHLPRPKKSYPAIVVSDEDWRQRRCDVLCQDICCPCNSREFLRINVIPCRRKFLNQTACSNAGRVKGVKGGTPCLDDFQVKQGGLLSLLHLGFLWQVSLCRTKDFSVWTKCTA